MSYQFETQYTREYDINITNLNEFLPEFHGSLDIKNVSASKVFRQFYMASKFGGSSWLVVVMIIIII